MTHSIRIDQKLPNPKVSLSRLSNHVVTILKSNTFL